MKNVVPINKDVELLVEIRILKCAAYKLMRRIKIFKLRLQMQAKKREDLG